MGNSVHHFRIPSLTRLVILCVVTSLDGGGLALAQGEHGRRIAAELQVIAGDLNKLQAAELPEHQLEGLRQRIRGGLVGLDILARLADQESNRTPISRVEQLESLRTTLERIQIEPMQDAIAALIQRYPLMLPAITENDPTTYARLHAETCAGCHDHGRDNSARPAYNLFEQTQSTNETEMYARMLVGVRGDRVTGIDNPLSDKQIIGLLTYYRSTLNE